MTDLQFAPAMVTARKTRGGGLVIESPVPLGGYETQVGQMLRRWAGLTPHNPFLAERNRDGQWGAALLFGGGGPGVQDISSTARSGALP